MIVTVGFLYLVIYLLWDAQGFYLLWDEQQLFMILLGFVFLAFIFHEIKLAFGFKVGRVLLYAT